MNKYLLVSAVFLLIFFYVFSREVKRGFLKQVDFNTTVRIQNKVPILLDELWEDIAFFVTPVPSIVIVGLLTILAFARKKIRLLALIIPFLFVAIILGELYGKSVVHHPAPPFFMIKNPTTIFPKFYINENFSYPSGHTARVVFLGITVWLLTKQRRSIGVAIGVYIALVSIGRIYLGHHWLSDVIGGGLLGAGCGLLTAGIISPIIDEQ